MSITITGYFKKGKQIMRKAIIKYDYRSTILLIIDAQGQKQLIEQYF